MRMSERGEDRRLWLEARAARRPPPTNVGSTLMSTRQRLGMTLLRQEGVLDRLERSAKSDRAPGTALATDQPR